MIIQLHITDSELKSYFENMGYETITREVTQFRSAYHNRCEPVAVDTMFVQIDGMWLPAKETFETHLKEKILEVALS